MPSTDRALRFLARDRPDVAEKLVRRLLPHVLREGALLEPEAVDDPRLDLPPPIDADFVARSGDADLLHIEFQGYGDAGFVDRVFRYHLSLVLRYADRRVTTVAIWLVRPPGAQRTDEIRRGGVTVSVASVVLADVPAAFLLGDPDTACFAAAADAGAWSSVELCTLIAAELARHMAPYSLRHVAVALAAMRGRYHDMVRSMAEAGLEAPIIIDLVKIGEDLGYDRGYDRGYERGLMERREQDRDEGRLDALRRDVIEVLETRGIFPTAEQKARIEAETDVERLRTWLRLAVGAESAEDLFEL